MASTDIGTGKNTNANKNTKNTNNVSITKNTNVILEIARLKGQEIKDTGQYYSAVQSQSIKSQSSENIEVLSYKQEDKDSYKAYIVEPKCDSC